MRIGNNAVFQNEELYSVEHERSTMAGVAVKAIIMLGVAMLTALVSLKIVSHIETNALALPMVIAGYLVCPITTFILSIIMSRKPLAARALAIPYAVLEGISIGAVCGLLKYALGDLGGLIAALAFIITLAFFLAAAVIYSTGIVKVGSGFRRFVFILGLGLVVSTLVIMIAGLFNHAVFELFYGATTLALIVSIISVIIASLYTLLTLDNAKRMVDAGLDNRYEWYCAFGIVLNFIWLFWEVLRLVMIIASRSSRN